MEQNRKNVGMAGHISLAGFKGINKCALLLIPVEFTDLADQLLIFLSVFRIFLPKGITYLRHSLPACSKQHLLCAKGACLVHVCPVNVDPVILSSHKETVLIQLSLTELHKRAHFRINLTHEFQISVHFIMIEHAQNPEQGIVHNGIDMSGHWIISAKCQKGSLVNIRVCQQILVYEKALISIAGPDPFVTLHAIQEKDSAAETEGMLCHIPDFVQLLIIALKGSTLREIHILIKCGNLHILSLAVWDKRKTYCTAWASLCNRIRLPAVIAMLQIKSLILRLSAENLINLIAALFVIYINSCSQLCLKLNQHTAVYLCNVYRLALFFCVFPNSWILLRLGEILAYPNRNCRLGIILSSPGLVRMNHLTLHISAWKSLYTACMNGNSHLSGTCCDLLSKWIFLLSVFPGYQYVAHCIGKYGKASLLLQFINAAKSHTVAEALALPECRPAKASLHTAEILLHSMI